MTKARISAIIIDSILILLTLVFIFGNSLQNVEQSTNTSEGVTNIIVEKIEPIKEAVESNKITVGEVEAFTRSLAHVLEFAALEAEFMLLFLLIPLRPLWGGIMLTVSSSLVLSVLDEALQMLNDRAAELVDVGKDFFGACLGVISVLAIYALTVIFIKKRKKI